MSEWPRYEHGLYACPCCGYHTLDFAPGSFDTCEVCLWVEDAGGEDPWNSRIWGASTRLDIGPARDSFERFGCCVVENGPGRRPCEREFPRYDWSMDTRVHSGPEARST